MMLYIKRSIKRHIKQSAIRLIIPAIRRLIIRIKGVLSSLIRLSTSFLENLRDDVRQPKTRRADLQKQDRLLSSFKAQVVAVRDASLSNRNLTAQQNKLQEKFKQTSTTFETLNNKVKSTARNIRHQLLDKQSKDADRALDSLQRLPGHFTALVGATVGIYSLKWAISGLLTTGDQCECLRVQFNAVMGSVEQGEGAAAVQWIKKLTRNTLTLSGDRELSGIFNR